MGRRDKVPPWHGLSPLRTENVSQLPGQPQTRPLPKSAEVGCCLGIPSSGASAALARLLQRPGDTDPTSSTAIHSQRHPRPQHPCVQSHCPRASERRHTPDYCLVECVLGVHPPNYVSQLPPCSTRRLYTPQLHRLKPAFGSVADHCSGVRDLLSWCM